VSLDAIMSLALIYLRVMAEFAASATVVASSGDPAEDFEFGTPRTPSVAIQNEHLLGASATLPRTSSTTHMALISFPL